MNKDEIKKLKECIEEFKHQDLLINIERAMQYHFTIFNSEIIVSDEKLIISDQNEKDIIIELFYLDKVDLNDDILCLKLSNDIDIKINK